MNIVKLYTHNRVVYVDAAELNSTKKVLRIYTKSGRELSKAGRTAEIRERAAWGVHRENLYASKWLAEVDRARIVAAIFHGKGDKK